ncbi:DNA primase (bacterial type) [Halapricum desulfuricans]|uniref:DNA primase DnaG n=1 Tax=Halapricum desulfuricans TaxID=2841257 RepID=A0A897NFD2_9EURY|nr:DNA primase DnaG [Halapricum desulfuricans]QSG11412.1 DNA primase (bacterial type) [Halapricum desulfuricans]
MQDSSKYLIHAQITANGVVERSDVVGAIFGQTEGLLGDELEIRKLQESAKLGRIDVEIDSEGGQSTGRVTIASGLDRVETSILAASLETIDRVGPCRATFEVTDLEDVRQAKRREIVERATELLERFDESVLSSQELIEEVRRQARAERITDFEGYPAGPRVADSDAIIVVEGRADVLQLLQFGIKNAIAVEGTNVPDAVARLTDERTVTAFLDGDRGGELILRELAQVGDVDYVAFAPDGKSVEDLSREAVMTALREKTTYEEALEATGDEQQPLADGASARMTPTDGDDLSDDTTAGGPTASAEPERRSAPADEDAETDDNDVEAAESDVGDASESEDDDSSESQASERERTLGDHIARVIEGESGRVRLLDEGLNPLDERDAGAAFDAIADAETTPATVVVDGPVDQRVLDVAAQRGVGEVIATEEGQFVKKPASVRLRVVS